MKSAKCKQCGAKWWIQYWNKVYFVCLVESSDDGKGSSLLNKNYNFDFWQTLNLEEISAKKQAEELKALMKEKGYTIPTEYLDRLLDILKEKGIVLEKLECPNCGGTIRVSELSEKEEIIKCKYCGKSILATNLFKRYMNLLRQE